MQASKLAATSSMMCGKNNVITDHLIASFEEVNYYEIIILLQYLKI